MAAPFETLIVLDFEATCWPEGHRKAKDHNIIEFPSVALSTQGEVLGEIEQFVKPVKCPIVSEFCTKLTTITQEQVDNGIPLREALNAHRQFTHQFPNSVLVTCGDWDLKTMLPQDTKLNKFEAPRYYRRWINLKEPFQKLYGVKGSASMKSMLSHLGLQLEGVHHRGIDDCRNIARIAAKMLADGWVPQVTGRL